MLKKLNDRIDRFCARHPRFGIPNLMMYIVGGTVVVYLLTMFSSSGATSFLWLDMERVLRGELWRLITFIFVPTDSNPFFLLISLYFYYFIGSTLERNWGEGRFTFYYLSGVVLTVLAALIGQLAGFGDVVGGTAYINLSMFFAFAMLYPDLTVYLFYFIPIKVKWLAYVDAAMFIFSVVINLLAGSVVAALMPVVAILNFFVYFSPYFEQRRQQARYRHSPQARQYRANVRQAQAQQAEQARQGYHHRCCVCGRTDADHPELQFRYCSRCAGYHCYCSDHIFSHVHFTEETNS